MDHMARQFESFRLELLSGKFLENDRFADRAEVLIKTFEIELMELWFHRVSANNKMFYGADFGEQVKSHSHLPNRTFSKPIHASRSNAIMHQFITA